MKDLCNAALRRFGRALPPLPPVDRSLQVLVPKLGLVPGESIAASRQGQRFRVFSEAPTTLVNNSDYYIYYFGVWEPRLARTLSRLIRPGDIAIDAGANIGWYTLLLSFLSGSHGRVYAFEPDPRAFVRLVNNIGLNDAQERTVLNAVALGRVPGTVTLHVSHSSLYSSVHSTTLATDQVIVPMSTLDTYVRENSLDRIDFLKLDVEGAEWDLLRGAEATLGRTVPPVLQLEVNPMTAKAAGYRTAELLTWLDEKFGYVFYTPTVRGHLVVSTVPGIADQLQDVYALHPIHHAERLARAIKRSS